MHWQWLDIFSEGGPFVLGPASEFLSWPGAAGWDPVLEGLEAPGGVHSSLAFFDPEDPGPAQVAWTEDAVLLLRWFEDGEPLQVGDMNEERLKRFDAAVSAAIAVAEPGDEVIELGTIGVDDGLVTVAWAAIAGSEVQGGRAELQALAQTRPREVCRFNDGGPALTAVQLEPGRYAATGVFDWFDEDSESGGTWLLLKRIR